MITEDCAQGTPEWFAARCGRPTASNFDKIVTSVGAPSKQSIKYMFQLAAERITKTSEERYTNGTMDRGNEMEAEAVAFYELTNDVKTQLVGVCYPDSKKLIAASPDRLVGEDGLLEIKCPMAFAAVGYLIDSVLPSDYVQQVQGQLLVTGRKWCDFLSYYPGLRPMLTRVYRDERFLLALDAELKKFCAGLDEIVEKIK